MSQNLRSKTIKGLKWSGLSQIALQISNFLIGALLARLLLVTEHGVLANIVIYIGFATLLADVGLGAALVQKRDAEERHYQAVFWTNTVAGLLMTLLFYFGAPLLANFYNLPILEPLTQVLSIVFTIDALGVVQKARFIKTMNFKHLSMAEMGSVLISGILAVGAAFYGLGVWSLIIQRLGQSVLLVSTLWIISSWRPQFNFSKQALKELFNYSSNFLGFQIINYWIRNTDNLLIGKMLGEYKLGVYAQGYKLMLLPLTQVNTFIGKVMFPALASIQNDLVRFKRIYLKAIRLIAFITFPAMVGLFATANNFIPSVYGAQWQDTIPILRILCYVGLLQAMSTPTGWIFISLGRTDIQFKWGLVAGFIRIVSFIVGIQWGLMGIVWAYFIGTMFLTLPAWYIAERLINLSIIEKLKNIIGSFLIANLMGGLVLSLDYYLNGSIAAHWILCIQVLVGVVSYVVFAYSFKSKAFQELLALVDEKLPNNRLIKWLM